MANEEILEDDEVTERPLTGRQAAFVQEYLIDLNGTQAAIRAGYSPNGAEVTAVRLLRLDNVGDKIKIAIAQRLSRVQVTQDSVLHEMSLLANSTLEHYYIDDEGQVKVHDWAPSGAMRAIQSIKKKTRKTVRLLKDDVIEQDITYDVEVRLWNKPEPLKLMGKHVGLFAERMEHTGKDGKPIEVVNKIERVIVKASDE